MPPATRDHEYTVKLAEAALQKIKLLELPGDPPSFETWYAYVGRLVPALNLAINDVLTKNGKISAEEIDKIYNAHLGSSRLGAEVERIGEQVGSEVDRVVGTIDAAINSAVRFGNHLSDIDADIADNTDRTALRAVVKTLVTQTRSAVEENQGYKSKLSAARREIEQLRAHLEAIHLEMRSDALTGLANRKRFDQALADAISRATRTSKPLSLMMGDVDHFKQFNDTWGHPLGDDVLRLIALTIKGAVRQDDLAARYGGEEFAIIFPDTSLEDAAGVVERLRGAVKDKEIVQRQSGKSLGRVTISCGVAQWRKGETARGILERADKCLYTAKRQGRDRVVIKPEDGHDCAIESESI